MPRGVHNSPRTAPPLTPEQLRQRGAKPSRIARAAAGLNVDVEAPEAPEELEGEAQQEWDRVTALLREQGLVTLADRSALFVYAVAYQQHLDAVRAVAVAKAQEPDGLAVAVRGGGNNNQIVHPARRALRDAQKSLLAAAAELGLTPAARQRLRGQGARDAAKENLFANNERGRCT